LPVILYGCETRSLTFREERELRVFENNVLRRIFGPKKEEDGSWRKLHNDELHSLYSSPAIVRVIKSRRMKWARREVCMGEGFWLVGPEGRNYREDLGVGRWILGRDRDRWGELDSAGSG
jgi:hypothetical protein